MIEAHGITNAWSYVWPAYGITWSVLVLYSLSLFWRRPKGKK